MTVEADKRKWNMLKTIMSRLSARTSLLRNELCEEERIINRYGKKNPQKDRQKALDKLAEVEKELATYIQQYRQLNTKLQEWNDYEIIFLLVYFSNIFTDILKAFSDSQETRTILGDHMEEYVPLMKSIRTGRLSKLFKLQDYGRNHYSCERQEHVTLEYIIWWVME